MAKYLVEIEITGDATKAKQVSKQAADSIKKNWLAIGAAAAGVAVAFNKAYTIAKRQEDAEKKLAAVIKSTGGAAGFTADEVKKMASSLQEVTTFGDEAILEGQNLLLTFTKIGKDVFPAATETMLNMSAALGTDLKSSAIQLGKALNDPVMGATALRRVGVSLTDQQLTQIKAFMKSNDILSAQKLILDELQVEFGGTAKAMTGGLGAVEQLKNAFGDMIENLVLGLVPVITIIAKGMKFLIDIFNGMPKVIKTVVSALTVGFIALGIVVKAFGVTVMTAMPWMALVSVAIAAIALIIDNWSVIKQFFIDLGKTIAYYWNILWINVKRISLIAAIGVIEIVTKMMAPWIVLVNKVIELWNKMRNDNVRTLSEIVDDVKTSMDEKIKLYEKELETLKKNRAKDLADHKKTEEGKVEATKKATQQLTLEELIENRKKAQELRDITVGHMEEEWAASVEYSKKRGQEYLAEIQKKRELGVNARDFAISAQEEVFRTVSMYYSMQAENLRLRTDAAIAAYQAEGDIRIAEVQRQIEAGILSEDEGAERKKQIEEKIAKNREKIAKDADKQERAIKSKAWQSEKVSAIIGIQINAALAVMKAFAQLGPIGGAIATAFIAAVQIAQTAIVASQKNPYRAARGIDFIVPSGYDRDNFPVMAQTGERVKVTPADVVEKGGMGGGNGGPMYQFTGPITIQANDPAEFGRKMQALANRQGAQYLRRG